MWTICKREFKSFFQTVIGWLFLAVTLGLFGLYFYVYNLSYGSPYLSNTLSAITFMFLFTVPVLTMRVLAEEKKSKTDQLILTSPISIGKIVIGKYLSMAAIFSIAVFIICISPLFLSRFGDIPYGECYVAILGYWLFGLTCIAIGTFISSLTESQVIAAVVTFLVLFLGYMMTSITNMISSTGNILTEILNCYNLTLGMEYFLSGFLDIKSLIYYISLIVLFLFLTTQAIQKRRFSISVKQMKTGVFSTGFIAIVIAAVVVVNMIGSYLPESVKNIDATSQKLYSITEDTKKVLAALEEDITIYVVANENTQDATLAKTLERYKNYSKHISVIYKDPAVSPSFYTNYTDGSMSKNSVIVEGARSYKVIDYNDIYEYEVDYSTYQSTVTGYDAEGLLTSAITYVTNESNPVIYQLSGHGEESLGSTFTDAVSKLNITLETINLLEEEIPENAEALIINAPSKDFSEDDVTKVLEYLEQGGKSLIVPSYSEEKMPQFEKILEAYEIEIAEGIVMEESSSSYYQVPYFLMPTASYTEASAEASGNYVFMPYAQGIIYPRDISEEEDLSYTEILSTSDGAYSKVNVADMDTYEKEKGDMEGPFALGLYVSKASTETELYLFSSGSFLADESSQMVYGNNATLFTGIISQFVTSEVTNIIPVKSYNMSQLAINQAGIVFGGLVVAILIPILLLIAGIVIWAKRRRK